MKLGARMIPAIISTSAYKPIQHHCNLHVKNKNVRTCSVQNKKAAKLS